MIHDGPRPGSGFVPKLASLAMLAAALLAPALVDAAPGPEEVDWTFADLGQVGGAAPLVLGSPQVESDGAVHFNGKDQGLILPLVPIAGWRKFTVAVFFRPEDHAPQAQRFLHIEDAGHHRLTVEDRVVEGKGWYLDTFLLNDASHRRTLIDPARLHPLGQWAWAELVYDGRTMASYVNGEPELSGPVDFAPMDSQGQTSVGVRLNRVFWFQGEIKEVRFYPSALPPADLPRAP